MYISIAKSSTTCGAQVNVIKKPLGCALWLVSQNMHWGCENGVICAGIMYLTISTLLCFIWHGYFLNGPQLTTISIFFFQIEQKIDNLIYFIYISQWNVRMYNYSKPLTGYYKIQ